MQTQYPVKVQAIRSKGRTDRFYAVIPLPLVAAIGLEAGEKLQWSLTDRYTLAVQRLNPPVKDKKPQGWKKKKAPSRADKFRKKSCF